MISNDIKTRIVLAISGNRQNYATDAKHAVALGISTSVYSEIKKGNTEQKLSDAKWMSIARRLGGGGHTRAAGCELLGDLENAKNAILAEVEAELDAPQEEA